MSSWATATTATTSACSTAFVEKLRDGYQLVMGNRFQGGIAPGAMPPLHRYLGNPVLTAIGRLFFRSPCGDFHCGLRGFRPRRDPRARTCGAAAWSSPARWWSRRRCTGCASPRCRPRLSPDGRCRPPHLRSWRDGWRHLRFLLLFSPRWLFFYPGALMFLAGLRPPVWLLPASVIIGGIGLDIHTLLYASMLMVIGMQAMQFWVFAKIHGLREGIVPPDPAFDRFIARAHLEKSLIAAALMLFCGVFLGILAFSSWKADLSGGLDPHTPCAW